MNKHRLPDLGSIPNGTLFLIGLRPKEVHFIGNRVSKVHTLPNIIKMFSIL